MSLDRFRDGRQRPDWLLALLALSLTVFGLVMILSASAYLAGTSGNPYVFVTKQLISFGMGLIVLIICSQIDYHRWRQWAPVIFGAIILLLLAVLISPAHRGVHRWIDLGPISFQPAEFVKLGFLIYLAAWFARLGSLLADFRRGFVAFFLMLSLVTGFILLEPDMGTAVTLALAAVLLYFLAGAPWHHLSLGLLIGTSLLLLLIVIAPYRLERLQTFLNPANDPQGAGYHTNQVGIAIGSGGLWGLGFGQGKLKYLGYVPEVHTDSIFAVVVEELGFVRALVVIVVFLWFIMRGFRIAKTAPDPFGQYLAAGLVALIFVQVSINLAAMLGLVPLTGIPLPLISYGGSSLVVTLAAIGILLSISRYRTEEIRDKS